MIEESKLNLPITECRIMSLFKRQQIILIFIGCLFSAYYEQKVQSPQVHILKPLTSSDGMFRQLGQIRVMRGRALRWDYGLTRRERDQFLSPQAENPVEERPCEGIGEVSHLQVRQRAVNRNPIRQQLALDFPDCRTLLNLCYLSHLVYGIYNADKQTKAVLNCIT